MHALIVDGVVAKYPYTIGNLRRDNPNTSFPKRPSDTSLKSWGMEIVVGVDRPVVSHAQNLTEGVPDFVDGQWKQTWVVTDATPEEIAQRAEEQAHDMRTKRDKMIADTDWMALSDNTLTPAWATYRQALRDITVHPNFPYLLDDDWPAKPN